MSEGKEQDTEIDIFGRKPIRRHNVPNWAQRVDSLVDKVARQKARIEALEAELVDLRQWRLDNQSVVARHRPQ